AGRAVEGDGAGRRVTEIDGEVVGVTVRAAVVEGDAGAGRGVADADLVGERRDAGRGDRERGRAVARDVGVVGAAPGVAGERERGGVTRGAGGDNGRVGAGRVQNRAGGGAVVREGRRDEPVFQCLDGGTEAGVRGLAWPVAALRAGRAGEQLANPGSGGHGKSP